MFLSESRCDVALEVFLPIGSPPGGGCGLDVRFATARFADAKGIC